MAEVPKELLLHPDAVAEMKDSVAFYREQGDDPLANRFKTALQESLQTIRDCPICYPLIKQGNATRKARLPKYPFSVVYFERPNAIWIVAIAHGSRKPGYWFRRLGQE